MRIPAVAMYAAEFKSFFVFRLGHQTNDRVKIESMVPADVLSHVVLPIIERVQLHHQIREGPGNENCALVMITAGSLARQRDANRLCLDLDGFLGEVSV